MGLNRTASIRLIRIGSLVLVALVIVIYAVWRSLNYARGPHITIFEPLDGTSISASTAIVKGRADRVNKLTLNSQPISMDEQGNFDETVTIFPGVNILTLQANDQFNRSTDSTLHLFGTVEFPVKITGSSTDTVSSSSTKK